MKFNIMNIKISLLLIILNFSLLAFSQVNRDNKKEIQGKWILEDISLMGSNDTITKNWALRFIPR